MSVDISSDTKQCFLFQAINLFLSPVVIGDSTRRLMGIDSLFGAGTSTLNQSPNVLFVMYRGSLI